MDKYIDGKKDGYLRVMKEIYNVLGEIDERHVKTEEANYAMQVISQRLAIMMAKLWKEVEEEEMKV